MMFKLLVWGPKLKENLLSFEWSLMVRHGAFSFSGHQGGHLGAGGITLTIGLGAATQQSESCKPRIL